ncbi:MAG: type III-A CRISPR-associated RAMP protein Csm4 [Spirochaetales bacterium]|nr:type III-A CRISPR-associated RAMP protein Csm4 [Spirochaetales bacterium]
MYLVTMHLHNGISFTGENNNEHSFGIIHSDTLFSALINQLALFNKGDFTNFNFQNPPFRISSAFPFLNNTWYLPKPMGIGPLYMTKLKDYSFLPLSLIVSLAKGESKITSGNQELENSQNLFYSFRTPRVSIDRITAAANPYWPETWYCREGGGLYFLLDITDNTFLPTFMTCMHLLGESGLGSDRSVGRGIFSPEIIELDKTSEWNSLFTPANNNNSLYYSLSLCWPKDHQEAGTAEYYKILTRKGWIFSTSTYKQMKRRECKMFAEGSLFSSPITGGVADLTPEHFTSHSVYRYGLGMMVAFKQGDLLDE